MAEKPNADSVTDTACGCGHLQRESADPSSPVQYDDRLQEYRLAHRNGGYSLIYHCPWCGGAVSRSRRERDFAVLTGNEVQRLEMVTSGVHTPEQAVEVFGSPAVERQRGWIVHLPPTATEPGRVESYRTMTFTHLSPVADVVLVDFGERGIKWQYLPRYIGPE
jgi:hypothetical protein